MSGYIKLYRSMETWQWYKNVNTKIVFLHLLIKACWCDEYVKGVLCKRGQWVTSRAELSNQLNLSEQQVRTALSNLTSTNEITTLATKGGTLITIVNYDKYQERKLVSNQDDNQYDNLKSTEDSTREQPKSNQASTNLPLYKNNKNINNYKNIRNTRAREAVMEAYKNNWTYADYKNYCLQLNEEPIMLDDFCEEMQRLWEKERDGA